MGTAEKRSKLSLQRSYGGKSAETYSILGARSVRRPFRKLIDKHDRIPSANLVRSVISQRVLFALIDADKNDMNVGRTGFGFFQFGNAIV
jgi:hypothetical protein